MTSWLEACQDELRSLKETRTYTPVSTDDVGPVNIIGNQWVFALKRSSDGSVERYKARLVTKGFNQAYLIDYDETFAPVVKWASIRILLALGARFDWEIHHMDVKTAFLNGDLEHSIYMEPPVGSADFGSHDILWKLQRSLYSLKQSSRAWYQKARDKFLKLDFICCNLDHSVFLYDDEEHFCIIALYVDDLMIVSSDMKTLNYKKRQLKDMFQMKDLGEIHWFLGMEII